MSTITVPNLRYCGIAIGGWGILYVGAASFLALQGRVGDTPHLVDARTLLEVTRCRPCLSRSWHM